jgi:Ca-activated chloride channel family protein
MTPSPHRGAGQRFAALAAVSLLLGSGALFAQQVFRAGTDAVVLNITVTDADNHLVSGLDRSEFQVFEDGVPQDIGSFSRSQQPMALAVLIDTSTSMVNTLPVAQEAAIGFIERLGDQDIAEVIRFDSRAEILQPFTADRQALERAIRRTAALGTTSLYTAVTTALVELHAARTQATDQPRRQAIVVLSDGEDTSSRVTYEEVLDRCKRSEVGVYAIGLKPNPERPRLGFDEPDLVFRTLTAETGGRAYFINDVQQLPAIYQQVADELANQYTLDYTSKNVKKDGAWRRIVVKTARPGTSARTKNGYFGPKAGLAPGEAAR